MRRLLREKRTVSASLYEALLNTGCSLSRPVLHIKRTLKESGRCFQVASFRKNFWAFIGFSCLCTAAIAILCGYFFGLIARLLISSILALPLGVFVNIALGRKIERSDRLGAIGLAVPLAGFLAAMWLTAILRS